MKVLKIGGSFITKKSGYREPDQAHLAKAAKAVASIWKNGLRDFVLVHGAGSYGHPLVIKHGINDGIDGDGKRIGYSDTHAACSELSLLFVKALIAEGVPAVSIPPAAIIRQKNKRIDDFREDVVNGYLSAGYLPVLYGDMVPDSALGGSVCSGDQIVAYFGWKAEAMILATIMDGVLDDKGNVIPLVTSANFPEVSKHLRESEGDVTGAMAGKLRELLAFKTPSYIVNAAHPDRIEALMAGRKAICTEVRR